MNPHHFGMGMTSGTLIAESSFAATGVFPPPGHGGLLSSAVVRQNDRIQSSFTFGTGSGSVDHTVFQDKVLAALTSATYDLYVGTDLPDLNNNTAAFRIVRYLSISVADGGDTSGVRIGGAAANEWLGFFVAAGDKQDIFPDGPPYLAGSPAGKTVTSTTKNLKIENLGAVSAVVRIIIGGSIHESGGFTGFGGFGIGLTYP